MAVDAAEDEGTALAEIHIVMEAVKDMEGMVEVVVVAEVAAVVVSVAVAVVGVVRGTRVVRVKQ
jgi:hypothetical protein